MRWPLLASSGATPARAANAASLRTRPRWDQLTSSWAATTGPTPGSASSVGPGRVMRNENHAARRPARRSGRSEIGSGRRSSAVFETVTRCSMVAPAGLVRLVDPVQLLDQREPSESWARRCSGATTIKLLSSLIALVRLIKMPCRVTST